MKTYIPSLLALLMLGFSVSQAQKVPSSCSVDQSVIDFYEFDVNAMALEHIFEKNLSYKTSVEIPSSITAVMMDALAAVYNVEGIPASDTVAKYLKISALINFPEILLDEFVVETSNGNQWAIHLSNDVIPTGHQQLDTALIKYGFEVISSDIQGSDYSFRLKTGKYYNIYALVDDINAGGQDILAWDQTFGLDWPRILVDVTEERINLKYYYDWLGDFIYSRVWEFNVYNDCSVEYIGVSGDVLSTDVIQEIETVVGIDQQKLEQTLNVFPNPAVDYLRIEGLENDGNFEIRNITGQLLKQGTASSERLDISNLQSGVYFLSIDSESKQHTISFIKE